MTGLQQDEADGTPRTVDQTDMSLRIFLEQHHAELAALKVFPAMGAANFRIVTTHAHFRPESALIIEMLSQRLGNILEWMETRFPAARRTVLVVSESAGTHTLVPLVEMMEKASKLHSFVTFTMQSTITRGKNSEKSG